MSFCIQTMLLSKYAKDCTLPGAYTNIRHTIGVCCFY